MTRKMASIQTINNIRPIEGADRIEMADVLGYHVVIGKDQFKEGDKIIYIECDALLPKDNPEFSSFEKYNYRVRIQKLRGQVSMGLVMPLYIMPAWFPQSELVVGTDVSEVLHIIKYEPPISVHLGGLTKGAFPSFIPKTDEIRVQNIPEVLERHKGRKFITTEKLDGSSITLYIRPNTESDKGYDFGVCSRNLELTEDPKNVAWKVVRERGYENIMQQICKDSTTVGHMTTCCGVFNDGFALQGEIIGNGINGNHYQFKANDHEIYFFNVFDIKEHKYLSYQPLYNLLTAYSIPVVPYVGELTLNHTVDELLELSKGQSIFSTSKHPIKREGLVFRPLIEGQDPDIGRLSFKAINSDYLIKLKD